MTPSAEGMLKEKELLSHVLRGHSIDLTKTREYERNVLGKQERERLHAEEVVSEIIDLRRRARDSIEATRLLNSQ